MHHEKVAGNSALVSKGARFITSSDFMDQITSLIGEPNALALSQQQKLDEPTEMLLFPEDEM